MCSAWTLLYHRRGTAKSSVEFDVSIENGAAIEREPEAGDRITGIQRSQEVTAREKGRMLCRLARRQEHCSSPVDPLVT